MIHRPHPKARGPVLFSFVVVADTHVNESDLTSSSPYHTNQLANERARHVFQDIAAMQPAPAFVVHLGDIVHPVPSLPSFQSAVDQFKAIAEPLTVPLYLVPGNHDVGDKRVDWMPADQVCSDYIRTYQAAFGADYHAFDRGNLRFVFLNSLLLNSGLPEEAQQRTWCEQQLADATGKRVFMFMHYPPYIYSAGERSNYDNVDEPGRSWLVAQMKLPQVEGVFAGHVHNFWYDLVGQAEFYMLPSTAFLRHDFTEFYRVAPGYEFGRGDVEKFGYFVVDVFADGHVAYSVRTMGRRSALGEESVAMPPRHLAHPKTSSFGHVGVELRHPWTEVMQITATGGVQEFGRKWARNDYPLLALWEMGARLTKVPDIDLGEDIPRERMKLLARMGHRSIVTTLGAPKPALWAQDLPACGVTGFEVNASIETFARQRSLLADLRSRTGVDIYLSKILTYDGSQFDGKHFSHFVKAGFTVEELDTFRALITDAMQAGEIDGVTVRIEAAQAFLPAAAKIQAFCLETGCRAMVSLKMSGSSIASPNIDDRANVARVAQSMLLSKSSNDVRYVFDTFMDVDRGYYPRNAFIDRRFNPRPAAQAFTTLTSLFSGDDTLKPETVSGPGEDVSIAFGAAGRRWLLACGSTSFTSAHVLKAADVYDLVSGLSFHGDSSVAGLAERLTGEHSQEVPQVLLIAQSAS